MEDGPRDKLLDGLSQYLGRPKKTSSVHLSFHENLMNVDEMDGKWKVESGNWSFFFPSENYQFHSISILFKHPLLPMVCVSGS